MKDDQHHHSESHSEGMSDSAAVQSVSGQGVINKVMPKNHMINITHEPMEALNWPEMRMNFKVDKSVDLSAVEAGQEVEFLLDVREGDDYLVTEIKPK